MKELASIRCLVLVEVVIHSFSTISSLVTAVDRGAVKDASPPWYPLYGEVALHSR